MATVTDLLCKTCEKLDLKHFTTVRTSYAKPTEFNEFWDVSKVSASGRCPLCRLVVKCLLSNPHIAAEDLEHDGSGCRRVYGRWTHHELQLSVDSSSRKETKTSMQSLQLCDLDSSAIDIDNLRTDFDVHEANMVLDMR